MTASRRIGWVGALGLLAAGVAAGPVDDPATAPASPADLQRQIRELRDEVRELRAALGAGPADRPPYDARDVEAAVDSVLRDADARTRLLAADDGAFVGGWRDGQFAIRSADGRFLLHPYVHFQFRSVTNVGGGGNDAENGFEARRVKFGFDGNAFGPDLKYHFLWGTDRKTGDLVLEEAFAAYRVGTVGLPDPVTVQAGQFKDYFAHESLASSRKLFAAERSLVNVMFTGGDNFVQGVGVQYNEGPQGGPLKASVAVTDGANDANRNFQDYPNNRWDFGVAARVEYKAFGHWKDYEDFTALGLRAPLLVVGAGVDYSQGGDFAQLLHTVDVQYKAGPWALYAAFLGRCLRNAGVGGHGGPTPDHAGGGVTDAYDWGVTAKAGYLLTPRWEVFGQYSFTHLDASEFGAAGGAAADVHEVTAGVNWYLRGHAAKVTVDFTWLPDGSPVGCDGAGVLVQPDGDGEFVIRAQFQLLL
ncbi:MAG: porin [Phycisphaerae bacterium]